ncbi:MAG TPA: tetratricopeptide repeat protein [Gemmataceae bacterium]|nr:tetratricopeptide repeat protein [Gemmataceae bacterium]
MSPLLFLKILLVVVLILAIPAVFLGYQAHTNNTASLMAKGNAALEKGDFKEVERIQKLLEKKGEIQTAYLLHGKSLVYAGEASLNKAPSPPPFEETQQACQMVMGGAGLGFQAVNTRGIVWLFAIVYQKPAFVSSPALNAFRMGLAELAKIQDDGPIGEEGTVLAAECLMRLEEKRFAEEGLKALVKRHPDNLEAHRLLSAIYIDLNNPGGAVTHLQEWSRLDPSDGLPCRWMGFFQKDNNLHGDAVEAYKNALTRNLTPNVRADTLKELAEIYLSLEGNPSKALETISQGTTAFQNEPDILTMRVDCLGSMGRSGDALELVEQALRDNSQNTKILFLRAQMHINENKPDQALPLLEKAARLDPYDLRVRTLLMNTYRQLGKNELAAKEKVIVDEVTVIQTTLGKLKTTADGAPWNDRVRQELGELCLRINRPDEARTWLQAALACNPNNTKARRLLAQLPPKEKNSPQRLMSASPAKIVDP